MTTEFKRSQSPRLPENYSAHVERVLSKQDRRHIMWRRILMGMAEILWWVTFAVLIVGAVGWIMNAISP